MKARQINHQGVDIMATVEQVGVYGVTCVLRLQPVGAASPCYVHFIASRIGKQIIWRRVSDYHRTVEAALEERQDVQGVHPWPELGWLTAHCRRVAQVAA